MFTLVTCGRGLLKEVADTAAPRRRRNVPPFEHEFNHGCFRHKDLHLELQEHRHQSTEHVSTILNYHRDALGAVRLLLPSRQQVKDQGLIDMAYQVAMKLKYIPYTAALLLDDSQKVWSCFAFEQHVWKSI